MFGESSKLVHNFLILVTALITLLTSLYGYEIYQLSKASLLEKKQNELLDMAFFLEREFEKEVYYEVFQNAEAKNIAREEKIVLLNEKIQPILERVNLKDQYRIGVFSYDLKRIIAIRPDRESVFSEKEVIPALLRIYQTNQPAVFDAKILLEDGTPVNSLIAQCPIIFHGKVLGHTWASVSLDLIGRQLTEILLEVCLQVILIWFGSVFLLYLIFRRQSRAIEEFTRQIKKGGSRNDIRYPELLPIFDTIAELRKNLINESHEKETARLKLEQIIDACPFSIIAINKAGLVMNHNKASEAVFQSSGMKKGQCFSQFLKELNVLEDITKAILTGEELGDKVIKAETREYLLKASPVRNEKGEITGAIAVFNDITEREKLQRELAHFDRLNLVGEMAAGIGHEVRNPMTTVRGYLQFFKLNGKFSDYQEQLDIMIEELDRGNGIITEFLSLAKDKALEMKQCNLNTIINYIFPLLQGESYCKGHILLPYLSRVPDICGDEKELRQLIFNLIRNGMEAMETKGTIVIGTYEEDAKVTLMVQDTGPGIAEAILPKIGTPFFTTKESGNGLGLSICYRIAQRHNARIEIKTSEKGTIFYVRFPIYPATDPL